MAALPDTQNKAWASNKSAFGFKMLQRMGWSEGKGLGKDESGMSSHIKIKRRSDQLGIGAEADTTGNVSLISAVQDFNAILAKLQTSTPTATAADSSSDSSDSDSSSGSESAETGAGAKLKAPKQDATVRVTVIAPKRRAYVRALRNKDVSGYSKHDLSAILGHKHTASTQSAEHSVDVAAVEHVPAKATSNADTNSKKSKRSEPPKKRQRRSSISSDSSSSSSDSDSN